VSLGYGSKDAELTTTPNAIHKGRHRRSFLCFAGVSFATVIVHNSAHIGSAARPAMYSVAAPASGCACMYVRVIADGKKCSHPAAQAARPMGERFASCCVRRRQAGVDSLS